MDDLKPFAKYQNQIDSLLNTVQEYIKDVGMRFGISKYFVDYEGRKVFCCGIERPSKEFLTEVNESEYKTPWYLRIYDILQRDMKGGQLGKHI